ncbi:MAG: hypothetical protein GC162_15975 [Planctomycetes bacterium]|nr:hypothetical protein [Planctomycetota bacterium]
MPPRAKPNANLFDRRTVVVWVALIVSMTFVSGVLLMLEPAPLAPSVGPVLTVLDAGPRGADTLFATQAPIEAGRWQAIVVHDSRTTHGDARTLGAAHQQLGYGGLVYDFVIGNGDGAPDGEIQTGYRWSRQMDAAAVRGTADDAWYNRHAIHVCLIGDGNQAAPTSMQMDQLLRLVTALQYRLHIPSDRVLLLSNITSTDSPGLLFPASSFRQQLLDLDVR